MAWSMSRSAPANWRRNVAISFDSAFFSCKAASIFGNRASSGSSSSGQRVCPAFQSSCSRACRAGGTARRAKPAPSRASRRSRRTCTASTGVRAACGAGRAATPIVVPLGASRSQAGRPMHSRATSRKRLTAGGRCGIGASPGLRRSVGGDSGAAQAGRRRVGGCRRVRQRRMQRGSGTKKRGPGASSNPAAPEDSSCGMAPAEAGWMQAVPDRIARKAARRCAVLGGRCIPVSSNSSGGTLQPGAALV